MSLLRTATAAGFAAVLALSSQALPTVAHAVPAAAPAVRFVAAPADSSSAALAADYLATQFVDGPFLTSAFTGNPDPAGTADAILGLAAAGTHQTETLAASEWLQSQAASFATSAGRAGKLAIVASAMGVDPTNYGGIDLIAIITTAFAATPDLGDAFSQSLAIIGLGRAGVEVPQPAVDALIASQDASGAFGYVDNWTDPATPTFVASPDTTGVALMALISLPEDPATRASIDATVAWATATLLPTGYWDAWSPSNSAGLLGSALLEAGEDVSPTVTWLEGQQKLAGGGLPASLNGTDPESMATAQGMLLLAGVSLNSVIFTAAEPVDPDPVDPVDPVDPDEPGDSGEPGEGIDPDLAEGGAAPRPLPETGGDDTMPAAALLLTVPLLALAVGRRR